MNNDDERMAKLIKGAFLKKEIQNFNGFPNFLSDFIQFAKNEDGIRFGIKNKDDRQIWINSYEEHKQRRLQTIEKELLDKLFRHDHPQHLELFDELYPSLKNLIHSKNEEEINNKE